MTPEETKAVAEIFRRLSRKENLSAVELRPAVKYLLHLKGFKKEESDIWAFFSDCFTWFCDKQERFAELPDAAVIYQVADRFEVYLRDRMEAEKRMPDQPPVPVGGDDEGNRLSDDDFAINGEQRKGYNVPSTSWKELAAETDYERARQKAEARRWLKSWLGFLRSFSAGWRKKDPTYRLIQKLFIGPKIKVVKEVLKRKSPSKK